VYPSELRQPSPPGLACGALITSPQTEAKAVRRRHHDAAEGSEPHVTGQGQPHVRRGCAHTERCVVLRQHAFPLETAPRAWRGGGGWRCRDAWGWCALFVYARVRLPTPHDHAPDHVPAARKRRERGAHRPRGLASTLGYPPLRIGCSSSTAMRRVWRCRTASTTGTRAKAVCVQPHARCAFAASQAAVGVNGRDVLTPPPP
jgi:hypothetical protein